jgi:hypothetical protein
MLRALGGGLLRALAFCHVRGVYHGSLGLSSVLATTLEDEESADVIVKLENLGFGRCFRRPDAPGAGRGGAPDLSRFQGGLLDGLDGLPADERSCFAIDAQAAAVVLTELWSGALAPAGAPPPQPAGGRRAALQRLMLDVFSGDVEAFRQHCVADADAAAFVAFMDDAEGAGWALLRALLGARTPLSLVVADCPLFDDS